MIVEVLIFVFIGLSIISAVAILLTRNVLHGALCLIVCLVSLAGIYLLLQAEFLAVTQIIIYAGGVLVLIIFGIMLTPQLSGKAKLVLHHNVVSGILVSVTIFGGLSYTLSQFAGRALNWTGQASANFTRTGLLLFTRYAAAFELSGLLLLVCLIAAAILSSNGLTKKT